MRCPKCFARVTHDKIFDVYDCPNGCHNESGTKRVKGYFDRDDVITEAEYKKYFKSPK